MFQCIRAANRVPTLRVLSANGNQDYQPTATRFPPTSDAFEAAPKTKPPCHILLTNQETLSHKGTSTSGHNQHIRYGMEERFAFYFPVTSSVHSLKSFYCFWGTNFRVANKQLP
ncbi:hypothetical protein TNCV_1796251 [Trichonephila clavipes]|nr:hypothetical protein TNCV_1796251 [Trichonephila clavipes]